MPLALHGGSGSGDENIRKAVEAGINKGEHCHRDIQCMPGLRKTVWMKKLDLGLYVLL